MAPIAGSVRRLPPLPAKRRKKRGVRVDMQLCALVREPMESLGVKSGTPALLVVRTSFDKAGRVVEYGRSSSVVQPAISAGSRGTPMLSERAGP
jgi:hypothetical protein